MVGPMTTKTDCHTGIYAYDERDRVWLAHVSEIPQVHTYGRTLAKAQAHLREALALWLEIDEDELDLECLPEFSEEVADALSSARRSRVEAAEAAARAVADTFHACRLLQDAGLSQRDIASQLGISHQRVHQLLDGNPKKQERKKTAGKKGPRKKPARKRSVAVRNTRTGNPSR